MLYAKISDRLISSGDMEADRLEKLLTDDVEELRKTVHRLTQELIKPCRHCVSISPHPDDDNPISCVKFTNPSSPLLVSADICLHCGDYKSPLSD